MEPYKPPGGDSQSYYVWQPAGKPYRIHLSYDVVDHLTTEVMRGFGAVPRRGVEVGGLLLGSVETAQDGTLIRIDDFEPVQCQHLSGPSFLLSPEEREGLKAARERRRSGPDNPFCAVGYFRSHTRDGLSLDGEDLGIMDEFFPEIAGVALLVKPYVTRPSVAGFFVREESGLDGAVTPLEFPFRRRELRGELGTQRRRAAPQSAFSNGPGNGASHSRAENGFPDPAGAPRPALSLDPPPGRRRAAKEMRPAWVWIPLSFIFLLLGVVVGFQAAISLRPRAAGLDPREAYTLQLVATESGQDIDVRWNRQSPAVRSAVRGTLTIADSTYNRTLDLTAQQLQAGSVIYRKLSNKVRFRLEVFTGDRSSLAESVEFGGAR